VNAIYFKGEWAVPFRERSTKPADFHVDGGEAAQVPTMHRTGEMLLFHDEQLQALQLPYAGGELAMLVLLPRQQDGLAELEAQLTLDRLDAIVQGLAEQQVELALPRFRMETQFELSETLQAMGMRQAFGRSADLTGIATAEDLYVKAVVHKAFVEVNEEGTEAAAATAVGVGVTSMPPSMIVDRPFLFVIRERLSGTILFLGQVNVIVD
jgi:serpin B